MKQHLTCGQVWQGIQSLDVQCTTSGVSAALFSSSADGDRGGDIYFVSVCSSDLLTRIALVDVMGHGEHVIPTSTRLHDSLQEHMNNTSCSVICSDMNAAAKNIGFKALSVMTVVAWYRHRRELFHSHAGSHPLLIRRRGTRQWQQLPLANDDHPADGLYNLLLGADSDTCYDQMDRAAEPGDTIAMFSDGLIEAPAADGSLFGLPRLMACLEAAGNSPEEVKTSVMQAVRSHVGPAGLVADDVTFIAVELQAGPD